MEGLSIVWGDVRQNLNQSIGDGLSVDIWFDSWVREIDPLANHLLPSIDPILPHVMVASMTDSTALSLRCGFAVEVKEVETYLVEVLAVEIPSEEL
ncbi:hypothetical protein V6N13_059635 [Hibiscus sabdariffa]